MSTSEQIRQEVAEVTKGDTFIHGTPNGEAIFFKYQVTTGKHSGRSLTMGVSMQNGDHYPDIPPHFVHTPADIGYAGANPNYSYSLESGQAYHAFSRIGLGPWDKLAPEERNMKAYIEKHLPEFWKGAI